MPDQGVPDHGSVWDTGPQYPWQDPTGGTDSPDPTPPAMSPVDLDAPVVAEPSRPSPEPATDAEPPWWRRPLMGLAMWIWLVGLAAIVVVIALVATTGGSDPEVATDPSTPDVAPTPVPTTVASTVAAPTTVARTTVASPTTVAPTTIAPTTVATPTTVARTTVATPTTVAPTTVPTPTTVVPPPVGGPTVTIIGSVGPCDFGSDCLIAGFTIADFDVQPTEFVCEFADGSRYPFQFNGQSVEHACATGNTNGSITIEVDGVRSETFTHP